jgi:hypothetical protein
MRRSGHPSRACELLIRACHDIAPTKSASVDSLAMYGNILNVAAYTAATGGDRDAAGEFIAEAAETATRVGPVVSGRVPTFNIAGVTGRRLRSSTPTR